MDNRVRSTSSPDATAKGAVAEQPMWGTPEGAVNTGSRYDSLVAAGRVFTVNAGTLTAPITGVGAYVTTTPDLAIDVPVGTTIKPLRLLIHYEIVGTTQLMENIATISNTLNAASGGADITPVAMRNRGGGTSNCTATSVATVTAAASTSYEFHRSGFQLVEDFAAQESWESRTFEWVADEDGPAPLVIGDAGIRIWTATQNPSNFITFTWAEFQDNEY